MRLIIVRHGETEENLTGVPQGHMQNPLNDNGIQQARKVAERLKAEKMDVIYSSDLKRARMTTEEIIKYHPNVPLHFVKELREINYGIFTGDKEGLNKAREESDLSKHEYKPPEGESYKEMNERAVAFLEELKKRHMGQTVLLVTHGGIKRVVTGRLMGMSMEEYKKADLGNTAISIINFTDKGHEVMLYNCTKHLE
jgi:broad specificity phosphatase PhoE